MPKMLLNRNYVLASLRGHRIKFIKGEAVNVPPSLVSEAVAIGAVMADGAEVNLLPEDAPKVPITPIDVRKEAIFKAFDRVIDINDREDFRGNGSPTTKAVVARSPVELNPPPRTQEVDNMWRMYFEEKARKAEEGE